MKVSVQDSVPSSTVKNRVSPPIFFVVFFAFFFLFFLNQRTESFAQCWTNPGGASCSSTTTCPAQTNVICNDGGSGCTCGANIMSHPGSGGYQACLDTYGPCGCYGFGDSCGSCHELKYDFNGGNCTGQSVRTVQKCNTSTPGTCTRPGHTLNGFTRSGCGTLNTTTGVISGVTCNTTVTVNWSIAAYTVTYDGNGGTCTPSSRTVNYGGTSAAPSCSRTGYNLAVPAFTKTVGTCGSLTTSTGAVTNVTCNLTIRANWVSACSPKTCNNLSPGDFTLDSCPSGTDCQSTTFNNADTCNTNVTCYKPRCLSLSPGDYTLVSCPAEYTCESKLFAYANGGSRTCYRPYCTSLSTSYTLNDCSAYNPCESQAFTYPNNGSRTCFRPHCIALSTSPPARYLCNTNNCDTSSWTTETQTFAYPDANRSCYRPNCSSLDSYYTDNECTSTIACPSASKNYSVLFGGTTYSSSRMCYCNETNVAMSQPPSSLVMSVHTVDYSLSTNSASPRIIRLACADNAVSLSLPSIEQPATSGSRLYVFNPDAKGEYLSPFTSRQITYPAPLPKLREEGQSGQVVGYYRTTNTCIVGSYNSPPITGYYLTETNMPLAGPGNVSMIVHGTPYLPLSSSSSNPTEVRIVCADNAVDMVLPHVDVPVTAARRMYIFNPDAKGEYLTPFTSRQINYPNPIPKMQQEGATGSIMGYYRTTNRCDLNPKNSTSNAVGYYKVEVNQPIPGPANVSMVVHGVSYFPLSNNPSSPTEVRLACSNDAVEMILPFVEVPSTAFRRMYIFNPDGKGEYLSPFASRQVNYPSPLPKMQQEGVTGSIVGYYRTTNRCDLNPKNSLGSVTGYYKTEINDPLTGPNNISMIVHDENYFPLSPDPNNPTEIRIPCADNAVDMILPLSTEYRETLTSRLYVFNPDSLGNMLQPSFKDRIVKYPNPTTIMKEGETGLIVGYYRSTNRCDLNPKDSLNRTTGYYTVKINQPPAGPDTIKMFVDDEEFVLQTNAAQAPTRIKYPSTDENVWTWIPQVTKPNDAATLEYHFEANNWGARIGNSYEWISFGCDRSEDYCSFSPTNNLQRFRPNGPGLTYLDVLKSGAYGQIDGMYYTTNMCGENPKFSDKVNGYYVVNNIPEVLSLTFQGDPYVEESNCTASDSHSGIVANNEVVVTLKALDLDGTDEVEGMVLYFARPGEDGGLPSSKPTFKTEPGGQKTADNYNAVGMMIRKGSDISNPWASPRVYANNASGDWVRVEGDSVVRNHLGLPIARITNIKTPVFNGNEITFEFSLKFEDQPDLKYLFGTYTTMAMAFDDLMLMNGKTELDQSHFVSNPKYRFFNWTIDMEKPAVSGVTVSVTSGTTASLSALVSDVGAGIKGTVLDAYRGLSGGANLDVLTLISPSGYPDILPISDMVETSRYGYIGRPESPYTWDNGWFFMQNTWPNVEIDINLNDLGDMVLYVTPYDQACNKSADQPPFYIDLKPWIATKGGVVFSEGNFGSQAKDLSETDGSGYTTSSPNGLTLRGYDTLAEILTRMTTGTELLSSKSASYILTEIIYSNRATAKVSAVRAAQVRNEISREGGWFRQLKDQLERQKDKEELSEFTYNNQTKTSDACPVGLNCYTYTTSDIVIGSGFVCDKKTLFMTEGNIVIQPNVTNEGLDNLDNVGCLFVAQGDITIEAGDYASQGRSIVHYDYIQGYMIAERQIHIPLVDLEQSVRDGIEVDGGLVALGEGIIQGEWDSAIVLRRNVRLLTLTNPVLVTTWDVRYAKISEIFFGKEAHLYKQEVGFKVF